MTLWKTVVIQFAIAACVSQVHGESPWPMFRHDLQHTARSQYTGPATPDVQWTFQANDGIVSSPSIGHDGTIYVGSAGYFQGVKDSSIYAINPDGSLKWKVSTDSNYFGSGSFSSPTIGQDGTIFIGSADDYLYAIEDSVTYGRIRWRTLFGIFAVYSSPAIGTDGTIYVGGLDFTVNAIRPQDGTRKWKYTAGWCVFSSPAIRSDGTIIIGSKDHRVYAFEDSLNYGKVRWSYAAGVFYDGHLFDSSPAIGEDGTVYIGADPYGASGQTPVHIDTAFYAINPDGSLKWRFAAKDGVESSPAIGHDGTIYFGSYDSCLYAIEDAGDHGSLKWFFKTGGPIDGSPSVDGAGIIYVGSRDSNMYAIRPDGTERWRFPTGGGIESSPTIDGSGNIIFGSFDGNLYCLGTGAPDVGIVRAVFPDSVQTSAHYHPTAVVRNYRNHAQSSKAVCNIMQGMSSVYSDTAQIAALAPGGDKTVQFDPWLVPQNAGQSYSLVFSTLLAGDDNTINDTATAATTAIEIAGLLCGDVDGSSFVDIDDIVFLINFVFGGGTAPSPYETGDADCHGGIDIDDIVYIITYVFAGGPPPCEQCK